MMTLNLNSNYAEQMLSLYLWNQPTPPAPSELADEKWIRPSGTVTTAEIDASSYMIKIGSHLALADQKMFQIFFNNEYRTGGKVSLSDIANIGSNNGNEIILDHEQFVTLFYQKSDKQSEARTAELNLYHYRTNTDSEDYWQRAFTFGSSKFKLDTKNIKYIFDANTGKAIRLDGVQVKPLDVYEDVNGNDVFENFDFDSNQGIAKEINSILK